MRTVISVSLPKKISLRLEKYAKLTGRNKSDIVKESLSLYLWESRFLKTRNKLIARGKKSGIVTEDDVFKDIS